MEKFKSRKFLASVGAALIAIVGYEVGIPNQIILYALSALSVYVGVEGLVDFAAVVKNVRSQSIVSKDK